jgi:haloacetate dehalogenase
VKDVSDALTITTPGSNIFLRKLGTGPALLLLHGFPETHLMWRRVAPVLANNFTVICPDLRGYGNSGCPPSNDNHEPYTKRAMAEEMVFVMEQLGFTKFSVAGHDRGARVAYRMAIDFPDRVLQLSVLDIVPTSDVWDRADKRFASAFWPWSLFSQPTPLPERLIALAPDIVIDNALATWGTPASVFEPEVREAYSRQLQDENHVHAICEEYRAAATMDYEHDKVDRDRVSAITCPLLVLWSAGSSVGTWYQNEGGPLGLWRHWATDVRGWSIKAGHFFPEEAPEETANALREFFLE